VFTEHGRHHPDFPRKKRMLFNRLCLRGGDRVVAVGSAVRQALIDNEGISAAKIRIIYNGVAEPRHEPRSARQTVRETMGVTPADFVVILVARFDPVKDLSTALHSIEQLVLSVPSARLVLVGDGPERGAVEELIHQRRLRSYVRVLGFRQDVRDLLAASDVCLLTSLSEGIPLSLIEAMAERLPVVATSVGGVPEVVLEGRTGYLSPPGDAAAIACALARLACDDGLRRSFGKQGHERAHSLFSQERMCDDYRRLYAGMRGVRC
jgi:glycosyltransferase involved in cell wall biosynthesis